MMNDYYDKFGNLVKIGSVILFRGVGKDSYNTIGVITKFAEKHSAFIRIQGS